MDLVYNKLSDLRYSNRYTQLPFIRDSVDFKLVCLKNFSRLLIVVFNNFASFSGNFRVSVSSIAMNSIP